MTFKCCNFKARIYAGLFYHEVNFMGKPVAKIGDITPTFGTALPPPAETPVIFMENVTVEPLNTKIKVNGKPVLVDGDKGEGVYGNKLQVIAANKLITS